MKVRSLRLNLFLGIITAGILTGSVAGYVVYDWAYGEAIEMQDSILMQIASVVRSQDQEATIVTPLQGVDTETHAILVRQGRTSDSARFEALWSLPAGLQDTFLEGTLYRAFVSERVTQSRFAVLQQTSVREEIGAGMALRTVGPILALIPVIAILVVVVLSRSFRSLVQLGRQLDSRNADDLEPISVTQSPDELRPFLLSINKLFKRVQELLDQQRKMISDAAHELRTPITALSIQAENLDRTDLPNDARQRVQALKSGALRTKHLLEQLLSMARQESGISTDQTIEIGNVAKKVIANIIESANRKRIDLGFEQTEELEIRSEQITTEILLRNIIDNAITYTPEGGKVDVFLSRNNDRAVICVEDTGSGISENEIDKIFDPFVRGKRSDADGSGLGLSIVQRITHQLSGQVGVRNKPDRSGLIVTVEIPIRSTGETLI